MVAYTELEKVDKWLTQDFSFNQFATDVELTVDVIKIYEKSKLEMLIVAPTNLVSPEFHSNKKPRTMPQQLR